MTVFVLLTIEDDKLLPRLINTMVETSVRFSVAKDIKNLFLTEAPTIFHPTQPDLSNSQLLEASTSTCCEPSEKVPKREYLEPDDETQVEVGEEDEEKHRQSRLDEALAILNSQLPGTSLEQEEAIEDEGEDTPRKKQKNPYQKKCQICQQWITAKNVRAHAGTHMSLVRLKCSGCDKVFTRMNRGVQHIKQAHNDDPRVEIKNAMTAEQQAELDEMRWKCFPVCCCVAQCRCDFK